MEKENTNIELFEAYLNHEMTLGEKTDFEIRLSAEPTLNAAFEAHLAMLGALQRNAENRLLKAQIGEIGKIQIRNKKRSLIWTAFAVVLLLLLLITGVWRFWLHKPPPPTAENRFLQEDIMGGSTDPVITGELQLFSEGEVTSQKITVKVFLRPATAARKYIFSITSLMLYLPAGDPFFALETLSIDQHDGQFFLQAPKGGCLLIQDKDNLELLLDCP